MKRIAIIPARGGSKRIPGKNIKYFCGRPMISYALDAIRESKLFDEIHVSTDSLEVASVVANLGFEPTFMRDVSLAGDEVGLAPVLRWVIDQYAILGCTFDLVCCLMPTAPLLTSEDLCAATELFEKSGQEYPLLVFTRFPAPIEWAFRLNSTVMVANAPQELMRRSQDLEPAYYECGPFSMWTPAQLYHENPAGSGVLPYILPNERAVDIDTPEDWKMAEKLYQAERTK